MAPDDDDDAAQLEALIIERALYHLQEESGFLGMTLPGYDREHDAVTYVVKEIVNLADRHGLEVVPIDIGRIAKKVSEIRAKQTAGRRTAARQRT